MRSLRRLSVVASLTFVAVLSACGSKPKTFDVSVSQHIKQGTMRTQELNAQAAGNRAVADRRDLVAFIAARNQAKEQPASSPELSPVVVVPTTTTVLAAPSSLYPCGGDLPSCYIVARESGGSYSAYNPSGCGGNGCYGKYQFSGAWAGKLGLPFDLSTATPQQQDDAARALWNHGAGASNWGA